MSLCVCRNIQKAETLPKIGERGGRGEGKRGRDEERIRWEETDDR